MNQLVGQSKVRYTIPHPSEIMKPQTLVERIMDARVICVGTHWIKSSNVDAQIFHDTTPTAFFGIEITGSRVEARICAQITAEHNGEEIQFATTKPNKEAKPEIVLPGLFDGVEYVVELFRQLTKQEFKKSKQGREIIGLTQAAREIVDSEELDRYLTENGYKRETLDVESRVRGIINGYHDDCPTKKFAIRVDDRHIADMCEDPSLIGRISSDRMIRVSVEINGLEVPITLVPDTGEAISIRRSGK